MVKVGEGILRKRGGLRVGEYESIKRHPEEGVDIVGPIEVLEQVKEVILHHHERFDGGGYPGGLSGEEIPVGARILAVVDSYSSMLSDRPYRPALSVEEAIEELRRCRGTQFDPRVVDEFVEILTEQEAEKRRVAVGGAKTEDQSAVEAEATAKKKVTPVGAGSRR
jgi:HD-GYP domain-containing protein (c-di-GMP phosphodiesterase class II)